LWPEGEEPLAPVQPMGKAAVAEKNEPVAETAEKKGTVVAAAEKKVPVNPPPEEISAVVPAAVLPPAAADRASPGPAVRGGKREGPVQPEPLAENPSGKAALPPSPSPEALPLPLPEPVVAEQEAGPPPGEETAVTVPSSLPEKKVIVLQALAKKRKVAETTRETKQPAGKGAKDPEQLLAERLRASSKWRAKSGYTIQLMALASETAEENFKGLLAQERYAAVKDQLYVVRKATPPTLFVYYGFFETLDRARLARDRLPDFLRNNQPYPLSVDQAAKKAKE
jgi:hypothetical protein